MCLSRDALQVAVRVGPERVRAFGQFQVRSGNIMD